MPDDEKIIYLTFDDGPHPEVTPFVLETLTSFNAYATFFCIGKNVAEHPELYRRIIDIGHAVGNHTHNHLNGWKTDDEVYLQDIRSASEYIHSNLFRPPYGRITPFQAKQLKAPAFNMHLIMWSVLSADFDAKITKEECLQNVLLNTGKGSIVVFHDSAKAYDKLRYVLPKVLEHFTSEGYQFKQIVL